MQQLEPIKQGDTFILGCTYKNSSKVAESVSDVEIKSQARRAATNNLVQEFEIFKSDQTTHPGEFSLSAQTNSWPLGLINIDIQFTYGDIVISTDTFQVQVIRDNTHD